MAVALHHFITSKLQKMADIESAALSIAVGLLCLALFSPVLLLLWSTAFWTTPESRPLAWAWLFVFGLRPMIPGVDRYPSKQVMKPLRHFLMLPSLVYFHSPSSLQFQLTAGAFILCFLRSYLATLVKAGEVPAGGKFRVILSGDSFFPKVDGIETFTSNTIDRLHAEGHHVKIVTAAKCGDSLKGAKVIRMPGIEDIGTAPGHVASIPVPWTLVCELIKYKPHVVHLFESANVLNVVFLLICAMLEVPTVMSHHTNNLVYAPIVCPEFPDWMCHLALFLYSIFLLPYASLNLSVSPQFVEKGGLLYPINLQSYCNDVAYWVSGTAVERYSPSFKNHDIRVMLAGSEENAKLPLVIHVGRIAIEKDCLEIPACFNAIAKAMNGQVRFAIVGSGFDDVLDTMKKELDSGDAKGLVNFAGWRRGHELAQIYASADCFFAPTRDEAFGLVYLEAMNSGLPCVGPNQGGAKDRITVGVHGDVYEPGNTIDCGVKVAGVLEKAESMRANCRKHAEQFTWQRSISDLLGFYSDVLSGIHISAAEKNDEKSE